MAAALAGLVALATPAASLGRIGGSAPAVPSWVHPAGNLSPGTHAPAQSGSSNSVQDAGLTEEETNWARTAWAYFSGGAAGAPPAPQDGEAALPPAPGLLTPARNDAPFATPWSIGDEVAALVIARRLALLDAHDFDRRLSRLVDYLNWMTLGPDGMPNLFYDPSTGAALGGDLQPGVAGWSAVETGRLLLWLRIAAETHPEFAPFIRNAVARLSVCPILSPEGRLQASRSGPEGSHVFPETGRGYDAYAAQGYRAWGLDVPLPAASASFDFAIEVEGVRFPLGVDVASQPAVLTTPPAYLGLEFGFEPLGNPEEEVAGGRTARELMDVVHEVQAGRYARTGLFTARADYQRSDDPYEVVATILDDGYPFSVTDRGGAARPNRALIATRAVFALDAFHDGDYVDALRPLVRELRDPGRGWFEGRYETTGAIETTRSSATNAFVLEALAYHRLGPLFPEEARPEELQPIAAGSDGACRLPFAVTLPP